MATISGLTETRLATGSSGLSHAMLCFYLKRLPKLDASLAELSRQIWWWNIEELWPALCCSQPCQSRPRSAAQGAPPPTTRRNRKTGLTGQTEPTPPTSHTGHSTPVTDNTRHVLPSAMRDFSRNRTAPRECTFGKRLQSSGNPSHSILELDFLYLHFANGLYDFAGC